MSRTLGVRVLLALLVGLTLGVVARAAYGVDPDWEWVRAIESIGRLWLRALQMCVVPLVFALLVTGIAAVDDARSSGRLAARAIGLFTLLLFAAGIYAVVVTSGLLSLWPIDRAAADAFVASVRGGQSIEAARSLDFAEWLASLAPSNPVAAAASDSMLAVVVFAVFFGFAVTRLPQTAKVQLTDFFRAVEQAMIVIVGWVLLAAPIGVLAIAFAVGVRAGEGAAGVLAQYVVIVSAATASMTLIALALAVVWGGVSLGKLAAAMPQPLIVAASTQSSIATLPIMLTTAREALGVPARVADIVLPLAVAVFRFTSPVGNLAVALFVAAIYGHEPNLAQIAAAIFVAYAVSVSSVGLPGQVSFVASVAPICVALGAPVEVLLFLVALEIIPDIFRTTGNVAGDLAVTTILNHDRRSQAPSV